MRFFILVLGLCGIIGCISSKQDLDSFFDEIYGISRQCFDLDLLLNNFFKEATNLGPEVWDLDSLIQKRTKTLARTYTQDDTHFLNDFLGKCPSGHYRTIKYRRSALGKDSFVRHLIHTLNIILFELRMYESISVNFLILFFYCALCFIIRMCWLF